METSKRDLTWYIIDGVATDARRSRAVVSTGAKLVLAATSETGHSAASSDHRPHPGRRAPLATDRSSTVATGTTERLLLVVKPPKK